jgi:streptogramin lyase
VELPAQSLSSEVRDSLKENYRSAQWKTLRDKLPDQKTTVEDMKVDEQNRFWLQLNYRGDTQQWLIMNQEGDPQKIVHLPKDGMVTHVSDKHLGVRMNEITFALYEPVN